MLAKDGINAISMHSTNSVSVNSKSDLNRLQMQKFNARNTPAMQWTRFGSARAVSISRHSLSDSVRAKKRIIEVKKKGVRCLKLQCNEVLIFMWWLYFTFSFDSEMLSTFPHSFRHKILVCPLHRCRFSSWGKTFCPLHTGVRFKLSALQRLMRI